MRIFVHSDFEDNLNLLTKKESKRLAKIIEELFNQLITSQYSNHPLKNANGLQDIHISNNVILLYKYDDKKELLDITLRLVNITDHDKLQSKIDKFKASKNYTGEWKSLDDVKKLISPESGLDQTPSTDTEKLNDLNKEFESEIHIYNPKEAYITLFNQEDINKCFEKCKELFDHVFIDSSDKNTIYITGNSFVESFDNDINLKEDVKMELEEPIEEVEVLPDVVPSEPIEVSTEPEVSEEERKNALVSTLNNAIMDIYSEMDNLNSILLSFDNLTEEDKATINNILDDRALHIGMLQSIVSRVDPRTSELIYQGMTDEVEIDDETETEDEVEDEVEDDGLLELEEPEE